MENKMKEWVKPELTVLVRSKPENAVLNVCKLYGGGGAFQVCSVYSCGSGIIS